jgi:hypothetical protein
MKRNNRISYAIPVCNEHIEIATLLNDLLHNINEDDQVVIQYDLGNTSLEVKETVQSIKTKFKCEFKIIEYALDGDFSSFKNNLKDHCDGDYIFQIDADERLGCGLLENVHDLIEENHEVEVFFLPRINIVRGITDEYIKSQGWRSENLAFPIAISEKSNHIINFPDVQLRLMKNLPGIKWVNPVHERLTGYNAYFNLGMLRINEMFTIEDLEKWCIIHIKELNRQKTQNEFYKNFLIN